MSILITDTTQTGAVSSSSKSFKVARGELVALRSTNLDGSGVVTLYYDAPDGSVNNNATFDDGTNVTLTPTNPERIINIPGTYRAAVTAAATTAGIVFVNK